MGKIVSGTNIEKTGSVKKLANWVYSLWQRR